MSAFADTLCALVHEGQDLFSRGEIAAKLAADCLHGAGYLGCDDLEAYRLEKRIPLHIDYGECEF